MDEQMTTQTHGKAGTGHPGPPLNPLYRVCEATALLLILSGLVHLVVFAVDGGPWNGPVSWRKPVTFGLSFGVTLLAVVRITSYVRVGPRLRTALLGVFAADCVVEVGGITLQAWRGVPSHLDMETPFDTAVSMTLAVGGGVLVVLLTVFAVASFRHRPTGPASMALPVRSGFAILLVALASGAAMIARGVVLARTGHQEAAYHSTAPLNPCTGSACTPFWSCRRRPGCCPAHPGARPCGGGSWPRRWVVTRRLSPRPGCGPSSRSDARSGRQPDPSRDPLPARSRIRAHSARARVSGPGPSPRPRCPWTRGSSVTS